MNRIFLIVLLCFFSVNSYSVNIKKQQSILHESANYFNKNAGKILDDVTSIIGAKVENNELIVSYVFSVSKYKNLDKKVWISNMQKFAIKSYCETKSTRTLIKYDIIQVANYYSDIDKSLIGKTIAKKEDCKL